MMALVESASYSRSNSISNHQQASWLTSNVPEAALESRDSDHRPRRLADVNLASGFDEFQAESLEALESFSNFDTLSLTLSANITNNNNSCPYAQLPFDIPDAANPISPPPEPPKARKSTSIGPFQRWMKSLHRRAAQRPSLLSNNGGFPTNLLQSEDIDRVSSSRKLGHRLSSSSGSSFGFITAVRSASASLASVSAVAQSKRKTRSRISRTDRSSRASLTLPRMSEDSCRLDRSPSIDVAAVSRALQRRRVLEEIINTEEGYIGDIRFLLNVSWPSVPLSLCRLMTFKVYITILASLPTLPKSLRSSINRNLNDIVELHDEILGELHRAIPFSEYNQVDLPTPIATTISQSHTQSHAQAVGHRRWRSLDAVPEHSDDICWLQATPGMLADAQVGAEVAKIFGKRVSQPVSALDSQF